MKYDFSIRMDGIEGSAIRQIFKLLDQPGMISFAGGMPSASSFPSEELADISSRILKENGSAILQYGATEGWKALRECIVTLANNRGIESKISNNIITTGSSQGIELFTKTMINPGDTILCEAPTFLGALQTFFSYQANVIALGMDQEGIRVDLLEENIEKHRPKFVYLIPTFQNPSGVTMSEKRRQEVYALCKKHKLLILEDDPYCELRFEGEPVAPLKAMDDAGIVVHLMSFSKTISPGLRVGSIIAEEALIQKVQLNKQGMDTHTSNLSQAMVAEFICSGRYYQHIQEIIPGYKKQRDAMAKGIELFPSGTTYTLPQGGLFFWLSLPEQYQLTEMLEKAVAKNVAYIPGTHFYANGQHHNTMRLNFSASTPEKIEEGMQILAEVIKENGA